MIIFHSFTRLYILSLILIYLHLITLTYILIYLFYFPTYSPGYRALTARHDKPEETSEDLYVELKPAEKVFDMPELIHNLDLLVDLAEDEIIQNDRK